MRYLFWLLVRGSRDLHFIEGPFRVCDHPSTITQCVCRCWTRRYSQEQGPAARGAALDLLADMVLNGQLHTECVLFPLRNYKRALEAATSQYKAGKVLLDLTDGA